MFCENCGNEMESGKFCPICGAEQKSVVINTSAPAPSSPIEPEASSIPAVPSPETSIPAASAPMTPAPEASIPVASAPMVPAPEASIPAASAPVTSAPTAPAPEAASIPIVPPPQTAVRPAPITVVPAGVPGAPTVIVENGKPDPKRKYTGGHIALCLILAGVMAAAAGVFAGLYFSLLWTI